MSIVFDVDGQSIPATLDDTPAAQAFAALLPLSVTLKDFGGGVEKIADLPEALPTDQAPPGSQPNAGTIAYYAPWGNLALFRQDFQYAKGLVKLGTFNGDFSAIDRSGPIEATIRRAD